MIEICWVVLILVVVACIAAFAFFMKREFSPGSVRVQTKKIPGYWDKYYKCPFCDEHDTGWRSRSVCKSCGEKVIGLGNVKVGRQWFVQFPTCGNFPGFKAPSHFEWKEESE